MSVNNDLLWLTPADLARRWQISISAVNHRACNTELLTPHRFGKNIRFKIEDILAAERVIVARCGRKPARRKPKNHDNPKQNCNAK